MSKYFIVLFGLIFFINFETYAQNCGISFMIDTTMCGKIKIVDIIKDNIPLLGTIGSALIYSDTNGTETRVSGDNSIFEIPDGIDKGYIRIVIPNCDPSAAKYFKKSSLNAEISSTGTKLTCDINELKLNLSIIKSYPDYTSIIWKRGSIKIDSVKTSISVLQSGTYTAEISNGICQTTKSINIIDDKNLKISITPGTICDGDQVKLQAISDKSNTTYTWSNGQTGNSIDYKGNAVQGLSVTAIYKNCQEIAKLNILRAGEPPAVNSFVLQENITKSLVFKLYGSIGTEVADFIEWTESGLKNIESTGFTSLNNGKLLELTPKLLRQGTGVIQYLLVPGIRKDQLICRGDTLPISMKVVSNDIALYVPEVFTPDSDGNNDVWKISSSKDLNKENFEILIFNRSGGLVYSGKIPASGEISGENQWDVNGHPDGVYYYIIKKNNNEPPIKGAVTMFRKGG